MYDVVIIGAGASGSFCALTLKYNNPSLKVLLLEKNDKLGKKLSITGNGRCNLGNLDSNIENYNSSSSLDDFKNILENDDIFSLEILEKNDTENYLDYLKTFGIVIKEDNKRLYPYSNSALSVCKSFERALNELNVQINYSYDVNNIKKENEIFIINEEIKCKKLVIATGGKTYPKTGSTGFGYDILKQFGHGITKLYPSLTSLKTNNKYINLLAGVRADGIVSLSVQGIIEKEEKGQIQFTRDSLSGICIFNLSRDVGKYLEDKKQVNVIVNLVPEYSTLELYNYLYSFRDYLVSDALSCIINNKLASVISKELNFSNKKIKELSKAELESVCFSLKNMYFEIIGTGDFATAQVTSGGAKIDEFANFLESKKCKGLYAIGEVLDVDGKCGGYNLSWAFNSALLASEGILKDKEL